MIAYFSHMTKIVKLLISAVLLVLTGPSVVAQAGQELSPAQQNQIKRGYGMFIHFGVNTFNETEWSDGTLPVNSYNPDKLDCDQWIKTAWEAGFRYVILITKHHDGFCLWDRHEPSHNSSDPQDYVDYMKNQLAELLSNYGAITEIWFDGAWAKKSSEWHVEEIGRCKIIKLPEPVSGSKLRLRILSSDQPPGIYHVGVASSQSGKIIQT
jgi:alpha-L-fucosidase